MNIKKNVTLAPYTIYKIGGPAEFFIEVKNAQELQEALVFSIDKKISFFVMGAGSNMLISDRGLKGLAIRIAGGEIKVEEEKMRIDAGVMMARAVLAAAKAGLSGFEWGIGVPGSVGGSIRGNAGCFGGEMAQIVTSVRVFEIQNHKIRIFELNNEKCEFGYRDSIFKKNSGWIITSVTLKLQKGNKTETGEKIKEITLQRTQKQDIGSKTCGCVFKNILWDEVGKSKEEVIKNYPELTLFADRPNISASFLIDKAGLKGERMGNIFVSPRHANFLVNEGKGKAEEVRALIEKIKQRVENKYGLVLEEEIQYIGF